MSFILDALKKSETDRQQHGVAEFAGIPSGSTPRQRTPTWIWVVAALLLVNLAVLVGLLMRPDVATTVRAPAQPLPAPRASVSPDFASQVATARENPPAHDDLPARETPVVREPAPVRETPPPAARQTPANTLILPTVQELQASGEINLPELHVDIHVYSEAPEDRFVFINMVKHKEGSQLAEGPTVKEITPDGVVLVLNGRSFFLPRE